MMFFIESFCVEKKHQRRKQRKKGKQQLLNYLIENHDMEEPGDKKIANSATGPAEATRIIKIYEETIKKSLQNSWKAESIIKNMNFFKIQRARANQIKMILWTTTCFLLFLPQPKLSFCFAVRIFFLLWELIFRFEDFFGVVRLVLLKIPPSFVRTFSPKQKFFVSHAKSLW